MKEKKVSLRGNLIRELLADITATSLGEPIQTGKFRKHPIEPLWLAPSGYIYKKIKTPQFTMEYLKPTTKETGNAILQLHGGGYIGPMKNAYRRFSVLYSEKSKGADVLTADYRVAPEDPFPAALEDAATAYQWLLERRGFQPAHIVVAGDSAGGGLAVALCLYLRDQGIPLPAGLVLMSPWTDLTNSGESRVSNYEDDPLFGNSTENMLYDSPYIGEEDPKHPYISPLFGDLTGLPPMLIQAGTHEVLLSDSTELAKKARAQGVTVKLSVYEGMFHVFQMAGDLLPEGKRAWNEAGKFICQVFKTGKPKKVKY